MRLIRWIGYNVFLLVVGLSLQAQEVDLNAALAEQEEENLGITIEPSPAPVVLEVVPAQAPLSDEPINSELPREYLRVFSMSNLKDHAFWNSKSYSSVVNIVLRNFLANGPQDAFVLEANQVLDQADLALENAQLQDSPQDSQEGQDVLGIKLDFSRRNAYPLRLEVRNPVLIEGVLEKIGMWVLARKNDHKIYAILRDYYGREVKILLRYSAEDSDKMSFLGWGYMEGIVPLEASRINLAALASFKTYFMGFEIHPDSYTSQRRSYFYLDNPIFTSNFFYEETIDYDVQDNW